MTTLGESLASLDNSSHHNRNIFVKRSTSGKSRPHDNPLFDQKDKYCKQNALHVTERIVHLFFKSY